VEGLDYSILAGGGWTR